MEKNSFTILEILVVVTIISILSGLSLATYNTYTQEKLLETSAQNVVDILELARKKAETSDLGIEASVSTPLTCTDFSGYQVRSLSLTTYNIYRCCFTGGCTQQIQSQPYTTNSTINIKNHIRSITFRPLNAGIVEIAPYRWTIKNLSLIKCIDIDINASGLIQMGDKYTTGC